MKSPTKAEKAMLDLVLHKIREGRRKGQTQIAFYIEPWTWKTGPEGFFVVVERGQPIDVYEVDAKKVRHK